MFKTVINVCSNFLQNYPLHFSKRALPAVAMVVQKVISARGCAAFASIGAAFFLYKRFIAKQQNPNSLQHLIECRYLNDTLQPSLYNHILDVVPANFRSRFPNFKCLTQSNNQLDNLSPDIFANLHNLEELKLSYNQLDNLSQAIFANLPNLKRLDLSDNKLITLRPGIFSNLQIGKIGKYSRGQVVKLVVR